MRTLPLLWLKVTVTWHTIKPGLAWPQSWPGPNFDIKVGPKQIFGLATFFSKLIYFL